MSRRSDECTKNTSEKSCSFEIVTDTYNLLHGHVSAVLNKFVLIIVVFLLHRPISFANKKIKSGLSVK